MSATTSTFRDYNADSPEDGQFSIDTSGDVAVITETWIDWETPEMEGTPLGQAARFDRDQARELGMRLIAWTGENWAFALHAEHAFESLGGHPLHILVTDGEPTLHVGNGPDYIVNSDITHDMGVRLLAWAGPQITDGDEPVTLELPWPAYTSEKFDAVYDRHAELLGRRPKFTVSRGDGAARVTTVRSDADAARAIIADLVEAVA